MPIEFDKSPVAALIFNTGETRVFSLSEAQQMLPLIRKITRSAYEQLEPYQIKIRSMLDCDPRITGIQNDYELIVRKWVQKVERLGIHVYGLWQIGFDTGDGYICWRFPEIRLAYYSDYDDTFTTRRPLAEIIDEIQPDWAIQ